MSAPKQVKCPTCRKPGDWFKGAFAPFCSKRCRLLDLGKWLGEEHRITEPLCPEHFRGFEDLPPGEQLDRTEDGIKGVE